MCVCLLLRVSVGASILIKYEMRSPSPVSAGHSWKWIHKNQTNKLANVLQRIANALQNCTTNYKLENSESQI